MATNRRHERGLAVYASQFQILPEVVASWFALRGGRFGEDLILSPAGAKIDSELSLRDHSLIVAAVWIAQGGAKQQLRILIRWAIQHGLQQLAVLLGVSTGCPCGSRGLWSYAMSLASLRRSDDQPSSEIFASIPPGLEWQYLSTTG